ncbi:hypothetical protein [Haladaptatus sp. GCM10025893]|uniref:hypothetical protein n=1 Tax=Haladaptatus sp. GCM10025893 TaxID=3252659 RepID=UPI0036F30C8D
MFLLEFFVALYEFVVFGLEFFTRLLKLLVFLLGVFARRRGGRERIFGRRGGERVLSRGRRKRVVSGRRSRRPVVVVVVVVVAVGAGVDVVASAVAVWLIVAVSVSSATGFSTGAEGPSDASTMVAVAPKRAAPSNISIRLALPRLPVTRDFTVERPRILGATPLPPLLRGG